MTKLSGLLTPALLAVALMASSAPAQEQQWDRFGAAKKRNPIEATFTVAFTRSLNTTNAQYCGTLVLPAVVAATGAGYSSLGALSLDLQKTLAAPGGMQGCAILTSPDGAALHANYAGTINGPNGEGTLTFTGGTGRFLGATGTAKFTGVFVGLYPTLTVFGGGTIPNIQGMAFYSVKGTVFLEKEDDRDSR
jgi:hypothetical protein